MRIDRQAQRRADRMTREKQKHEFDVAKEKYKNRKSGLGFHAGAATGTAVGLGVGLGVGASTKKKSPYYPGTY